MKINIFEGMRRIALVVGGLWVIGCVAYGVFSESYVSMTYAIAWPGERPSKAESCGAEDATKYVTAKTSKGSSVGVTLCFTAQEATDGRRLVPYAEKQTTIEDLAAWIVTNKAKQGTAEFDAVAKAYQDAKVSAMPMPGIAPVTKPWALYAALREADAKGDVERAKALAAQIQTLPPELLHRYQMNRGYSSEVGKYVDGAAERFKLPDDDMKDVEQRIWGGRVKQWKQALTAMFGGLAVGWLVVTGIGWIARGFMGIPRGLDARPEPVVPSESAKA